MHFCVASCRRAGLNLLFSAHCTFAIKLGRIRLCSLDKYSVLWHVHRQTLGRLINSPGRSTSRPPIPPFLVPGSLASAFPTDRRPRTVFFGDCSAVSCTKMPDKLAAGFAFSWPRLQDYGTEGFQLTRLNQRHVRQIISP